MTHFRLNGPARAAFFGWHRPELDGGVLAVVVGGMGGMAYGGEASHISVQVFLQSYMAKPADESVPVALLQALSQANQAVVDLAHQVGKGQDKFVLAPSC